MKKNKKVDIEKKKDEKRPFRRPELDEFMLKDVREFSQAGLREEIDVYRRLSQWR